MHETCKLTDNIYNYPLMSMGKVKVDSIDDNEEMQIMDEAFCILGFTNQEKTDVHRISAICMQMSRLEFTGIGEVSSPKNLDADETCNEVLQFAESGEALYDAFINPKYKVVFVKNQLPYFLRLLPSGSTNSKCCCCNYRNRINSKNIYGRLFRYLVDMCNSGVRTLVRTDISSNRRKVELLSARTQVLQLFWQIFSSCNRST